MIRFSASLVVIAMGLLVAGGVTSKLLLVYAAIALSAVALIFLVIGAILNRGEFRAQPSGDPAPHRDAEPEPATLVGAAPVVNPATSPASLAGQARAAATDTAMDTATDTATDMAPVRAAGKPPWPDSPPPTGRLRPDVADEQWPGKRLPEEFHPHAPWPAQRPAPPVPANFDWLTPAKPGTSGATEAAEPNRPREQPSAGAVPPPPPEVSAGPQAEAPAGAETKAPAGPTKPPLADAMKAPLADAIRELRAKASEKPRAAASGSAPPDAPAAPTQQLAAAQPAEPVPAQPVPAEPEPEPPAEPEPAKPEPPAEPEPPKPEPAKPEPAGASESAGQPVTVVPGVPRYHRSDCILIRFMGDKDLQKMPVAAAREAGCTPCRACQPDGEGDG